ncbi:PHP domain-containing protein [Halomarina litorea]|uniref:PHP domain-containing protein n=1 Tax=Halomarina litorea TaxID=2961595 RepID=UPI0020C2F011|nr:PHP domain-containing protein [Halomarina sp. BCD28]
MATHDLHTHTTYSDGSDMRAMVAAAERAGHDSIGLTDHCILWDDPFGRRARFDFLDTFGERRADIAALRRETDIAVHDAVEMTYAPEMEDDIADFLDEAAFDYAIGSVHVLPDYDVTKPGPFVDLPPDEKRRVVEEYFDWQVALVESELFDVMGHLDLPERAPALQGVATRADYERVAAALADSRTLPELNAGRSLRLDVFHPNPTYLDAFREAGVKFVLGTDSHRPHEVGRRYDAIRALCRQYDLEVTDLPALAE